MITTFASVIDMGIEVRFLFSDRLTNFGIVKRGRLFMGMKQYNLDKHPNGCFITKYCRYILYRSKVDK